MIKLKSLVLKEARPEYRDDPAKWAEFTRNGGLDGVTLGTTFTHKGKEYRIVGHKPFTKLSVVAERQPDGKDFFFTYCAVVRALGRKDRHCDQQNENKYVAQKNGASITFDADSDTDAERQAVQMQATRPKEIDYEENTVEAQGPMSQEWTYQDAAGRTHKGHMKQFFDHGGTDVTYQFIDKNTGEMSMVSGSRLKAAKRSGMSPMWVKEQGIGFPGVEPGTIPADYPDRKKKVAAARKQADRMRNEYKFPYEAPRIGDKVTYTGREHERLAGKTGTVVQIDHDRIKVQWSDGSSSVHFGNVLQREAFAPTHEPPHPSRVTPTGGKYHVTGVQPKKETLNVRQTTDVASLKRQMADLERKRDNLPTLYMMPGLQWQKAELNQKIEAIKQQIARVESPKKGLKEATSFRKGQTVQHFTNPKAQAVVVRYDPPKDYPEYGKGSWNNHSFAGGQGLLTVKFPNGHTETDFEGYWKPTAKEDKIVNEDYKTLRPLRKLIREELRQMLKESVIFWQAPYQGFMVTYSGAPGIGGTATVTKRGVPSDKFDDELGEAYKILGTFKATKPGSTWGSDGIGYIMNKKDGLVNVKKSGVVAKNAKAAFAELGVSI